MNMSDKMMIQDLELELLNMRKRMQMIDDNMDEILILNSEEAMREVALFVKQVVKG